MSNREDNDVIDLTKVRVILAEVEALVDELHGVDLNEREAVDQQSVPRDAPRSARGNKQRTEAGDARRERARHSQALNLLSDRLELAATMVRAQYWSARGHADPTVDGQRIDGQRVDGQHFS